MQFIDVETISTVKLAPPPKTKQQIEREEYEEVVKKDSLRQDPVDVTAEQKEKTIKCLFKVLDYQLMEVNEQANDIKGHYKRVDQELKEFDDVLKREENKLVCEEVRAKIKEARRKAAMYDEECEDGSEYHNVADLLIENKLLIDKVDSLIGKQERLPQITDVSERADVESEISILSHSLID